MYLTAEKFSCDQKVQITLFHKKYIYKTEHAIYHNSSGNNKPKTNNILKTHQVEGEHISWNQWTVHKATFRKTDEGIY